MTDAPLVSVVIPAYNASRFLRETLDSVLAQTHDPVEILLVDDGSTDATPEIAKEYEGSVRYIRQDNKGVSAARNRGLAEAGGAYICFLDADDWIYPDNLRLKVEALEDDPAPALALGWVEVTDEKLEPTGSVLKGSTGQVLSDLLRLIPPAIPCPSNALIRTRIVDELGGFDEGLSTSADYDLWLRIASRHSVVRVDQVLVKYRRHESAMFRNIEAQIHDMQRIFAKHEGALGAHVEWRILKWRFYRSVAGGFHHEHRPLRTLRYLLKGLFARWMPARRPGGDPGAGSQ